MHILSNKLLTFPVLCIALSELEPEVKHTLACLTECVVMGAKSGKKKVIARFDCKFLFYFL